MIFAAHNFSDPQTNLTGGTKRAQKVDTYLVCLRERGTREGSKGA